MSRAFLDRASLPTLVCVFLGLALVVAAVMTTRTDIVTYSKPAAAEFSTSQCYALGRAADFSQTVMELDARKRLVLRKIESALLKGGWKINNVQRLLWELEVTWGQRINPKVFEDECVQRGGKYGEGEAVRYDTTNGQ